MLWLMMNMTASADTFTLDNGAVIEGQMVVYNYAGECQMSITNGDLVGSIVIIQCDRIASFSKGAAVPAPTMEAPALSAAASTDVLSEPAPAVAPVTDVLSEPAPAVAPVAAVIIEARPVEPIEVEEVALAPEIVAVAEPPIEAQYAAESIEPIEAAGDLAAGAESPIEPEPEALAATPWSDAAGEPADGLIRVESSPAERTIGGVAIPALPNLRIIRAAEPESGED
jgi:hypothetical protein